MNQDSTPTGSYPAGECVFYGISFNPRTRDTRKFSQGDLDRELKDTDVFSWIDIQAGDIQELNSALRMVNIDLTLVSHFNKPEVLPRIVEGKDCLAFYLYEVLDPERHLDTAMEITEIDFKRLIVVLGANFIFTYHRSPLAVVDEVKENCEESFRLAGKTPGFVAFLFMQHCLYEYAHLNLANDNFLDTIEAEVLSGDPHTLAEKISVAGLNILTLKRLAASLHIILMLLVSKRNPFISDEGRAAFAQMEKNAQATREAIDSSRDLLDGIINSLQADSTRKTNEIMRVLTVVSTIILPLTLLVGIYGMNFIYMPELNYKMGYFVLLAIMGFIVVGLLALFYRLDWIGGHRAKKK